MLVLLSAWHLYGYFTIGTLGSPVQHVGLTVLAFIMSTASLFFRNAEKELARYAESVIGPARDQLIGAACFTLAGLHFITIQKEPVFIKMGFLVLLLAFFEAAGMANRFLPALKGDIPDVTASTMKRLLMSQLGILMSVFALSVALLYLSLMVVVGFTGTLTVAFLAAIMILALAFMTMIRNI
jgi:hypothetical protein